MKNKKTSLLPLLFVVIGILWNVRGHGMELLDNSHVHEAFMNNESPISLLTSISSTPPPPLKERPPQQTDPKTIWISGYWDWSFQRNRFVWCSGCWRHPPPGCYWISGSWHRTNQGWVRSQGFWSKAQESKLTYISEPPPDPYDEHPTNQPGDDQFWMSGYWKYENKKYSWFSGKWEALERNYIYVPYRYIWRPEGYVLASAFWDWPLAQRGTAYACLSISYKEDRVEYSSEMIAEPMNIIEGCLLFYPDYRYFYFYYCHFHKDWWWNCSWCPPWWGWSDWWWLLWSDQWGLWWWWCHIDYSAPCWLSEELMDMMFAPPVSLLNVMKNVPVPLIIGPKGVIPPKNLIDVLGEEKPIFPEEVSKIKEEASQSLEAGKEMRPTGLKAPSEKDEIPPAPPQTTSAPPSRTTPGRQPIPPKSPKQKQECSVESKEIFQPGMYKKSKEEQKLPPRKPMRPPCHLPKLPKQDAVPQRPSKKRSVRHRKVSEAKTHAQQKKKAAKSNKASLTRS